MVPTREIHLLERIGVRAADDSREALRQGLAFLVGPTRVKPGCLGCTLNQDLGDVSLLCFESCWESMDAFLRHAGSDLYRRLLQVLESVPDAPVIEYHEIATTHGLELLRSVRKDDIDGSVSSAKQWA